MVGHLTVGVSCADTPSGTGSRDSQKQKTPTSVALPDRGLPRMAADQNAGFTQLTGAKVNGRVGVTQP